MKLNCGLTQSEKQETYSKWHDFYAIWPRRVGFKDCRMFETIQRRGIYTLRVGWIWEYQPKQ